ncbi:MAG TPA: VTT domain-containing protein, partial [Candidatus Saccharimonadales bacterium]|nr:VTT domain-containing protein [Candidatus Saccharimonadales bacterium]
MEDNPPSAPKRLFGLKEIAALVFALGISVLIFVFRDTFMHLQAFGYGGAFLLMLISSASLILPAPGLFLIFALGGSMDPLLLGLVAGAGSALGELTGYLAGYGGNRLIPRTKMYLRIEDNLQRRGFWTILILALIPNPIFDIAGIAAGALRMHLGKFMLATSIGKIVKVTLVAYAGSMSIAWVGHW